MNTSLARLSNVALLDQLKRLVQNERHATAILVAHLAEVKKRRLYLGEGYGSMFRYCTQALCLSEHATYLRLEAAKMALRFPAILVSLESGAVNLTAIRLLAPYLTSENLVELLAAARHQTRVEIECFLARRFPRPDAPTVVRKLPVRTKLVNTTRPVESVSGPMLVLDAPAQPAAPVDAAIPGTSRDDTLPARPVIEPLAAERYRVQFTAGAAMHAKLRRAQDLLRHRIPNGDLAEIFELALTVLVEKVENEKLAATDRPRSTRGPATNSRTIPAEVKRAVWRRDGGQCAFVGKNQRRCSEAGFMEFHHIEPFARGGPATLSNIQLRCRAHNQYEALRDFGPRDGNTLRESATTWGGVARQPDGRAPAEAWVRYGNSV